MNMDVGIGIGLVSFGIGAAAHVVDRVYKITNIAYPIAWCYTSTTVLVGLVALFTIEALIHKFAPNMDRHISDRSIITSAIILTPIITHLLLGSVIGFPLTVSLSMTLLGVTVFAVCFLVGAYTFFSTWERLQCESHSVLDFIPVNFWEYKYKRNLDVIHDLVGAPTDNSLTPKQRSPYELAFLGAYTAAMFVSGCITCSIIPTPLASGLFHGTVALIDVTSRIILSRCSEWKIHFKSFVTSPLAIAYSFVIQTSASRVLGMPAAWTPVTTFLALLILGITLRTVAWSKVQHWIYQQPPSDSVSVNSRPLSLPFATP